ncbi:MAG: restriction endonuclease subunit S, partial [Microcystis panniformis]
TYLCYFLKSSFWQEYIASKMYGMKMPRLGTKDAEEGLIPLPPLDEQKRIVAKVDELMALCDALEVQLNEQQSHATALLNSLVHELIGAGASA